MKTAVTEKISDRLFLRCVELKYLDTSSLYRRSSGTYLDFPDLNYVLFARNTTRMEKEIRTERESEEDSERGKREEILFMGRLDGWWWRAMHRQHLVLAGKRMARSQPANVRKCRSRAIS